MEQMVKKTTLECEDSNRQYVSSLNGLAGLDIIEEKFENAVEKYREVLRVVDEYKGKIKTDTLQKLHSVSNLAELLEAGHENIPPTLRDDKLREEVRLHLLSLFTYQLGICLLLPSLFIFRPKSYKRSI